tara:strand:- start:10 stop:630 length:621 start_codon:yes stop_codon:yes gene_type:complete
MSQVSSNGDLQVANQGFPAFRGDLNEILLAIYSNQSGSTTPANNYANSFFYDTANNLLKFRNEDNDAYITIMGFDQSADTTTNIVSDATQQFSKAQIPSTFNDTFASVSGLFNFDTYQNFIVQLGNGANTLQNPTTEVSNIGQTGVFVFKQPSSGTAGSVSLVSDYETVGGGTLTLSSTNSAKDVLPYIIVATNSILLGTPLLAFS